MLIILVIYGRMTREHISGTKQSIIATRNYQHEINVMRTHRYVPDCSGAVAYTLP